MNSKLFDGSVEHERFNPASHRLSYKLAVYALDLSELATLDSRLPLFGYNRMRPVSLFDSDYLDPRPGSIQKKLLKQLLLMVIQIIVSQVKLFLLAVQLMLVIILFK